MRGGEDAPTRAGQGVPFGSNSDRRVKIVPSEFGTSRGPIPMRATFVFVISLFALPAAAQWNTNGAPVPDEPWRKSVGKFGAMLLLSDKPDEFIADWSQPDMPSISTTSEARRGEPIVGFVLFVGCKELDAVCSSVVDFTVLKPDGSEYAKIAGAELWKGKPAPPEDRIQLSLANLGIRIEPEDPSGEYTVKARVTDLHALRTVELERRFVVK